MKAFFTAAARGLAVTNVLAPGFASIHTVGAGA
jgi:hypothetical protein